MSVVELGHSVDGLRYNGRIMKMDSYRQSWPGPNFIQNSSAFPPRAAVTIPSNQK